MKLFVLLGCCCFLGVSQSTGDYNVEQLQMDGKKYALVVKEKDKLVYTGTFDTAWHLPIGTHFVYDTQGTLLEAIEFQLSTDSFEGVPLTIQTTYTFKDGMITSIKSAERCTECEFSPIGIWKYFDELGNLLKEVDTNGQLNKDLVHPAYEYFWRFLENGTAN